MVHVEYQKLSWKEKHEKIGKVCHAYMHSEKIYEEMNRLIEKGEKEGLFTDVEFFPNSTPIQDVKNPAENKY